MRGGPGRYVLRCQTGIVVVRRGAKGGQPQPAPRTVNYPAKLSLNGLGEWHALPPSNRTTVSYPQGNPLGGVMIRWCNCHFVKKQIATSADENIDALKDGGTDAKSNLRVRSRHVNRGWVKGE